jgi:hypothetical protein
VFVLFPAPVQWHIHDSSQFDAQCEIAEQIQAKELIESISWLNNKICEDVPQLCINFAAGSGHSITQEAIDRAERLSEERFARLSQDQVEKVRNFIDSQLDHLSRLFLFPGLFKST